MDVILKRNEKGSFTMTMTEGRQKATMTFNDLRGVMEMNREITQEIIRFAKEEVG